MSEGRSQGEGKAARGGRIVPLQPNPSINRAVRSGRPTEDEQLLTSPVQQRQALGAVATDFTSTDPWRVLRIQGEFVEGPQPSEGAIEHFKRHVREGRIFVGFDCDDEGLGYSIQRAGREAFLFASDYPHESFNAQSCRHEIDELLEREDLSEEDKEAVLAQNAKRFYGVEK